MSSQTWAFVSGKFETTVPIHSRLIVNTAAIDAAIASIGITRVLSYQAATAIRADAIAVTLEDFEP
jgi:hypothetical protein